jgi:hypothetical protein
MVHTRYQRNQWNHFASIHCFLNNPSLHRHRKYPKNLFCSIAHDKALYL